MSRTNFNNIIKTHIKIQIPLYFSLVLVILLGILKILRKSRRYIIFLIYPSNTFNQINIRIYLLFIQQRYLSKGKKVSKQRQVFMQTYRIKLRKAQKPILEIQLYPMQNNISTLMIITTIDKFVYLFQLSNQSFVEAGQFQTDSPCTSIFYEFSTKFVILGSQNGNILKYNQARKQLCNQRYVQINKQFPQIICAYQRNKFIYAWNLNSHVLIINQKSMNIKSRINMNIQITSACVLTNPSLTNYSACVSFDNKLPPFIFDYDSESSIIQAYKQLTRQHLNQKQVYEQQIYLISHQRNQVNSKINCQNKYNCIVTGSCKKGNLANQPNDIFYVCLYRINTSGKYKICELTARFQFTQRPININLHKSNMVLCLWSKVMVYNIDKRTVQYIKNKNQKWAFLIYNQHDLIQNNAQIMAPLISKGFNFWDPQNSKKQMKHLHFKFPTDKKNQDSDISLLSKNSDNSHEDNDN